MVLCDPLDYIIAGKAAHTQSHMHLHVFFSGNRCDFLGCKHRHLSSEHDCSRYNGVEEHTTR